jgi:hypothetical protein
LTVPAFPAWSAFEFALDFYSVTGDGVTDFSDDFNNGVLDPPLFSVLPGTVTESGTHVFLSDANGSLPLGPPFAPMTATDTIGGFAAPLSDVGAGTLTISARFRNDAPAIASQPTGPSFGIDFISLDASNLLQEDISLFVAKDTAGDVSAFFINDDLSGGGTWADHLNGADGADKIPTVTGDIVLELVLNQSTNLVLPRYSVDGGVSFIEFAGWDDISGGAQTFNFSDLGGSFPTAFGTGFVPVPAAFPLFVSALRGLFGIRFSRRKVA